MIPWAELSPHVRTTMLAKLSAYAFIAAHNAEQYRLANPILAREQEDLRDGWAAVELLALEADRAKKFRATCANVIHQIEEAARSGGHMQDLDFCTRALRMVIDDHCE